MTDPKKPKATQLGFLAVSATAPNKMATFPIMPGFSGAGPEADLQARLEEAGNWQGYALSIDPKGQLRLRVVKRAKA